MISFPGQMDPSIGPSEARLGRSEVLDAGLYFSDDTGSLFTILVLALYRPTHPSGAAL
jgi:hypothetical protein